MKQDYKQFFILVSGFVKSDRRRGIDRVVRNILASLLQFPPKGYVICPVYTCMERKGLFHANELLREQYGILDREEEDLPVLWQRGDFLLINLDRFKRCDCEQKELFFEMHKAGVTIWSVIYDLWATEHTEWYAESRSEEFTFFMNIVDQFDGVICSSRSVSENVMAWLFEKKKNTSIPVNVFHLGYTLENEFTDYGLPDDADRLLEQCRERPTFLIVATLKPRKRHLQALQAFEHLWELGININLLLVGNTPTEDHVSAATLVKRIVENLEFGKRLFWLQHATDEYLEKLYQVSSALLMPSEDEGFGLPVVEAAQNGLPLILRDIPTFREIAGEHAFYFHGMKSEDLSKAIQDWLYLDAQGKAPTTCGMKILSWRESTQMLLRGLGLEKE